MLDLLNAPGEIRTHGLRIRNPALYPPELRGREEYQLVTVIFFFSCVNLCLFVADIRQAAEHLRPGDPHQ